jgi:hypothetical protein
MSKYPLNKQELSKIIKTTQNIEGYKEASSKVISEVKSIREKYGIQVSIKK